MQPRRAHPAPLIEFELVAVSGTAAKILFLLMLSCLRYYCPEPNPSERLHIEVKSPEEIEDGDVMKGSLSALQELFTSKP